jgi:hypothetical protein
MVERRKEVRKQREVGKKGKNQNQFQIPKLSLRIK